MSTTTASVDLKPVKTPPPSISVLTIAEEAPNWVPERGEPRASPHERDAGGERARRQQGVDDVMRRINAMTTAIRRLRHALYAKDPRIQELNARIAHLKAALAEIEANAENVSAAKYLDAEANLNDAKAELRKAKKHVEITNKDKLNQIKMEPNDYCVTTDEYGTWSAEKKEWMKKHEELTTKERHMEAYRDLWKSEAERQRTRADALEIRLRMDET